MSLWLRERLRIAIAPEEVAITRLKAGWGERVVERAVRDVHPARGEPTWQAACDELERMLRERKLKSTEAHIVLAAPFYRAMVLPWQDDIVSREDRLDYARHRFKKAFGDSVAEGQIRLGSAPYGAPVLATSVESALIERLAAICASNGVRLKSLGLSVTAVFNNMARGMAFTLSPGPSPVKGEGRTFVLAVAEPGMLTLALVNKGVWHDVRQARAATDTVEHLETALRRELYCLETTEPPEQVFLSAPRVPRVETLALAGVKVHVLPGHTGDAKPAAPPGLAAPLRKKEASA